MVAAGVRRCNSGRMASTRDKLEKALAAQRLVRISRDLMYADIETCIVIAMGAKWVLVRSVVDGGYLDGFSALRIRDITAVKRDKSFAARSLHLLEGWSALLPESPIALDSLPALIETVGAEGRMFGLEKERQRRALWIGTLDEVDTKWLWLNEVTFRGRWKKKPLGYRLRAITRISFGGRYMSALQLAAVG